MAIPSSVQKLIKLWNTLPGIGEKTARRMVFFLLSQDKQWVKDFASVTEELVNSVHHCSECGSITDVEPCVICSDPMRDRKIICVVESDEDCAAIEQAGIYNGLYHVIGSSVSPMDDKEIPHESLERLKNRIAILGVKELILATAPRIEGDLAAYEIQDYLRGLDIKISRLSYGLPVGGSIGYADRMTLHLALESRTEIKD